MTSPAIFQLVSPALPVGAFSYSEGIEFMAQEKKLLTESEVFNWLESELLRGQLRIEAASISPMMDCLDNWKKVQTSQTEKQIYEWNSWLLALRDSKEVRLQQKQMGTSLLQLLADLNHPLPNKKKNLAWPIAWSWAGLSFSLPKVDVVQGYLYSWIANQLSATLRLLPFGPNKVQHMQYQLLPLIASQTALLLNQNPHDLWTGDIGTIMAQQSHKELYSKLFRS
ncbi:urease accessory protein UreF [Prochlorococcus sp. MIT 1341]|uniref:urease accessory protein UreF n=1 Tax=Prochlorococcus sp. MIT 1341 TaxID=3096221 RepID=UPI002A7601F8|nr:urease accessory UreF family protein [Prochlorococcus sp. MIT 1341]